MWPANALTERLRLKWPIIQAPMGLMSTPALAAAVSNAGSLGAIGMWGLTAEEAARRIAGFRQLSPGSLYVNYPLWPEPRSTAEASEECGGILVGLRAGRSRRQTVSTPNFFWAGGRENLDPVNRLYDVFQRALSVHMPRWDRLVQPPKRVGKKRAIGLLLSDLPSEFANFGAGHSRHLVRFLANQSQSDKAQDSQRVQSGAQERANARLRRASPFSRCSKLSARSSRSLAFAASRAFSAGVVVFASKRL